MRSLLTFFLFFIFQSSLVQASTDSKDLDKKYQHLKVFSDVLYTIEKAYVREVSSEKLVQGAVKGMMKELDPHSHFLPAKQLKVFKQEATGQFSGLGLELAIKNKQPIILSVLEDSPASKAGMRAGQIILQINNKKTIGLNREEISNLLKSRRGKKFNITVRDPNSKKIHQMQLRAEIVSFKSVLYKDIGDQFLYVRINAFTERTLREVRKIMNRHKNLKGFILDLRGNPGGLLESAIQVADLFIKKGTIVSIKGRLKDYEQVFQAHSSEAFINFPMIVLIDTYSASAAEILAGALKENKRAMLLGRKSFGKGSVQSLIHLDQGNAVKLTVAHYYTPNGNSIHEKGIEPHIELKQSLPSDQSKPVQFTSKEDTDFQQAFSFLKMFRYFNPVSNQSSGL